MNIFILAQHQVRIANAVQDNTISDRPMVELVGLLTHMLEDAQQKRASQGNSSALLHQLVIIIADGRFHEKESLRRVVAVRHLLISQNLDHL